MGGGCTDCFVLRLSTFTANDWYNLGSCASHISMAFEQEINTLGGDGLVHMGAKMWLHMDVGVVAVGQCVLCTLQWLGRADGCGHDWVVVVSRRVTPR